jgi:hypothetical protein
MIIIIVLVAYTPPLKEYQFYTPSISYPHTIKLHPSIHLTPLSQLTTLPNRIIYLTHMHHALLFMNHVVMDAIRHQDQSYNSYSPYGHEYQTYSQQQTHTPLTHNLVAKQLQMQRLVRKFCMNSLLKYTIKHFDILVM